MKLPVIRGLIDRRILVNYRVRPDVLAAILPAPFRPQLVHGFGIAGICLIRLRHIRPYFAPRWLGISSENAAHRIAVEWDDCGVVRSGVYVLRRDTGSHLNALAGGRIFPGVHQLASFRVHEVADHFEIDVNTSDYRGSLSLIADMTDKLPSGSVFGSLNEASDFFSAGSLGYSPARDPSRFQGLELRCRQWDVTPLRIRRVASTFFDDKQLFPPGSSELDCALLMRGIEHEWLRRGDLDCCQVASHSLAHAAVSTISTSLPPNAVSTTW